MLPSGLRLGSGRPPVPASKSLFERWRGASCLPWRRLFHRHPAGERQVGPHRRSATGMDSDGSGRGGATAVVRRIQKDVEADTKSAEWIRTSIVVRPRRPGAPTFVTVTRERPRCLHVFRSSPLARTRRSSGPLAISWTGSFSISAEATAAPGFASNSTCATDRRAMHARSNEISTHRVSVSPEIPTARRRRPRLPSSDSSPFRMTIRRQSRRSSACIASVDWNRVALWTRFSSTP